MTIYWILGFLIMFNLAVFSPNFLCKLSFLSALLLADLAAALYNFFSRTVNHFFGRNWCVVRFINAYFFLNFNSFSCHSVLRYWCNGCGLTKYRLLKIQWCLFKLVNLSVLIIFWIFLALITFLLPKLVLQGLATHLWSLKQ